MANYQTREDVLVDELVDRVEKLVDEKFLVVYNDDVNTFDHVIESLVDVCDHSEEQAEQCAMMVHFKGRASVRQGHYTKLSPMKTALTDRGINAVIE
jgi:ATP-dependent Clp protease adaptor protein ClpS